MVKILNVQINPIVGDFEGNFHKIQQTLKENSDFDIALFSELTLTGYPPLDLMFEPSFFEKQNAILDRIKEIAPDKLLVIGGIFHHQEKAHYHNSAFLILEGQIKAYYNKMCLPNYDVFDESRYFLPGSSSLIFEYKKKKIGISICEDIWAFADEKLAKKYSKTPFEDYQNLDCVLNLSASPFEQGKWEKRLEVVKLAAKKIQAPIIMSCQVGANDGLLFDGGSVAFDGKGQLVSIFPFFEEKAQVIDLDHLKVEPIKNVDKMEILEQGLILGIKDYFYKTGFQSCLIGLSGGIDSSLTLYLAVKALGEKNVHTFMIPSLFTSDMSLEDSVALAKRLKVVIHKAPLGKVLTELEEMVKAQTSYQMKGLTHENMQSRLRGLFLMAMSNQLDALVITTGNKSELAAGYATLYGDMCGCIAPLGDLFKTDVYALAKHIQQKEGIFPERVFTRAPSAELSFGQKDQDTLPPYEVMDEVLKLYIEEGFSVDKLKEMKKFSSETIDWLIKKLYLTEFKRKQYAPIIKVSKKTLGIGRIMPIAQKFLGI
jgi:NAD+ synthase (glutamine-hydrolysing)